MYTIITDNGGGERNIYHDITGEIYTFPSRYRSLLRPGTKVIYHRSAAKKGEEKIPDRLSEASHYFGYAEIGDVTLTQDGNYRATIKNYSKFKFPVGIHRQNGEYYEEKPFFQQGVRKATEKIYNDIIAASANATMVDKKPRRGHRTLTSLRIGIESKPIINEGRIYKVVTGMEGYYLQSPDDIFYELKMVPDFPEWFNGTLRILKLKDKNKYLIMHNSNQIGILTPISNGMKFEDIEDICVNINM